MRYDIKKTLFVSDLDGTLLNKPARTSDFTNRTINDLVARGMVFSYATARSFYSSSKVAAELYAGEPFYFTCIGEGLEPLYEAMKDRYRCVFQIDLYDHLPWLEIMPKAATKARAALHLKQLLGCDRIVAFGDGKNAIDLFEIADEAYAVANAAPELKAVATAVIGSNEDDGVAKWLLEHAKGDF